ncbi:Rab5, putative [Perkinsus marinus ATCC 50983]|uniref:Rab5, putative n=1 Tax=Perkinsus marinus (strain ATCC 50983 / TXsc) TaxID=423536 RepID=C5KTM1_PERM5|nr:Rab5, putative [Perkinsus marinus ATCC 50983]EER12200.1 Rab5, putative [Perkinsus marinus ATCC 50983]|eukprot:XP_002780405.1 Rab5, putative [Perkinsus marinus ATCC 50983]
MPVPKVLVGKVIVVGPASVGKTCLVTRFVDDVFDANTQSTLGCDSKEKTLNVTGKPIKLILYDTAGQERFAQLAGNYYRQADICLLCFDLSNSASFDQIKWWQNQVAQHNERAEFVLVLGAGSNSDLAPKLDVSFARRYANENGFPFFLTSSLTGGEQIEFLFYAVAEKVVRLALQRQMLQQQAQHSSFGAPVPVEGSDYGVAVARDYDRPIRLDLPFSDKGTSSSGCCGS